MAVGLFLPSVGQASRWSTYQDDKYGFSYSYPVELFTEVEGERPSFRYFRSRESEAKLMVGAWDSERGETPSHFKQWMLTNAGGYENITYQPRGRNWFILSGHRDDQIYYEKVIFSCGGRVVNVLAISYPEAQRSVFDDVVERMEDSFKGARRCS